MLEGGEFVQRVQHSIKERRAAYDDILGMHAAETRSKIYFTSNCVYSKVTSVFFTINPACLIVNKAYLTTDSVYLIPYLVCLL